MRMVQKIKRFECGWCNEAGKECGVKKESRKSRICSGRRNAFELEFYLFGNLLRKKYWVQILYWNFAKGRQGSAEAVSCGRSSIIGNVGFDLYRNVAFLRKWIM